MPLIMSLLFVLVEYTCLTTNPGVNPKPTSSALKPMDTSLTSLAGVEETTKRFRRWFPNPSGEVPQYHFQQQSKLKLVVWTR
ncbi:hypothetical protein HPP92_029070, partial [Vanilla planifolia]